jgi:hypothetical protein
MTNIRHRATCECDSDIPLKLTSVAFLVRFNAEKHIVGAFAANLMCDACGRAHKVEITNIDSETIPRIQPIE